jgi:hypothetical protein
MPKEHGIEFDGTDMLVVRRGGGWLAPLVWLLFWCMLYVAFTRGSATDKAQREADSIREQECRALTDDDSKGAANPHFICLSMGPDFAWTEMVEMEKARRDRKGR